MRYFCYWIIKKYTQFPAQNLKTKRRALKGLIIYAFFEFIVLYGFFNQYTLLYRHHYTYTYDNEWHFACHCVLLVYKKNVRFRCELCFGSHWNIDLNNPSWRKTHKCVVEELNTKPMKHVFVNLHSNIINEEILLQNY